MTRTGMFTALGVVGLLLVAAALPVAGDPVEPLVEHVEKKADEAQEDPVAFAGNQTSEEGLANETRWTRDYACFAAREAAREAGEEPPEVGVCPAYEEAREEDFEEKDQSVADELEPDPVAETLRLVDDAVGTVDDIVDDPGSALSALVGFLERSAQAVKRIVTGVVDFVKDLVGLSFSATLDGFSLSWDALVWTASLPVKTGQFVFEGLATLAETVGSGVTDAWDATTGLAGDGVKTIAKGVDTLTDSVRETVQSIFGTQGSNERAAPDVKDAGKDVDRRTDRLLDDVDDVLPEL